MFLDSLEARLYVCEWCLFWRADGGGGNKIAGTHEKGLSVCLRGFKGGKFKSKQVCETVSRQPHFCFSYLGKDCHLLCHFYPFKGQNKINFTVLIAREFWMVARWFLDYYRWLI